MLIAENIHPKKLQARLGHSKITTTLDTYGHLFDGWDDAAADALEASDPELMRTFRGLLPESPRPRTSPEQLK